MSASVEEKLMEWGVKLNPFGLVEVVGTHAAAS